MLKSAADIDRIANDGITQSTRHADISCDDGTRMEPDLGGWAVLSMSTPIVPLDFLLNQACGVQCVIGMVRLLLGRAPKCHDAVADEFIYGAALPFNATANGMFARIRYGCLMADARVASH